MQTHADFDPTPAPKRPTAPHFRLRYRPIFWRLFFAALIVMELIVWRRVIMPNVPFRPRARRILVLLYLTPGLAFRAMMFGLVVAVLTDLFFRLALRPLMVRWYNPRTQDPAASHTLPFQLAVGEAIEDEVPARWIQGRRTLPGTLIRTNRRLCFYSFTWDADPWFLPLEQLGVVRGEKPRRRVLGWIEGYPDHLVVTDRAGGETYFALAEPSEVLAWFGTLEASRALQNA